MDNALFSIALRLGARKARRQGTIHRDEFRLVRGVLRDPVRETTEYGSLNVLAAVQDFVTVEMLDDDGHEGTPGGLPALGILDLISYIFENMDSIMAFIRQIIDLFSGVGAEKPTPE